jgi:hypothetical protein
LSKDLRRYAKQTNTRLLVGFVLLLFIIGDGLIYIIFGSEAAVSGLICIFVGFSPLFLIWFVLLIIDWIVKRADR